MCGPRNSIGAHIEGRNADTSLDLTVGLSAEKVVWLAVEFAPRPVISKTIRQRRRPAERCINRNERRLWGCL
jgi:hypothetical protein